MPSGSGESDLVRAAGAGDGPAFACLYESYEGRIFNYLLRLLGDRHEAEDATQDAFLRVMAKLPDLDPDDLRFGPYLFTAARNAGYDVIAKRKKIAPSGPVPEESGDPFRDEPADLDTDPERSALTASQETAIRDANHRLPERQREVLALRELDGMRYDEIGSIMGMKSNAVAQLISRARIGLRKEMQVGAANSVAFGSPECEKAHGALAVRQDGQNGESDAWLDGHLSGCPNCRIASEEMAEAGVSYRAWAPIVPAAWLFREVMAKASETAGSDWSEVQRPEPEESPGKPSGRQGRRAVLAAVGSAMVVAVLATVLHSDAEAPEKLTSDTEPPSEPVAGRKADPDHRVTVRKVPPRKAANRGSGNESAVPAVEEQPGEPVPGFSPEPAAEPSPDPDRSNSRPVTRTRPKQEPSRPTRPAPPDRPRTPPERPEPVEPEPEPPPSDPQTPEPQPPDRPQTPDPPSTGLVPDQLR